jgi:serine/threonine protein kinase
MKTHLGHYEIVAELGRGGMGVVYKGYEPSLARYVAIKELSPALAHDPSVVERFLREARAMAVLSDPHLIQIHFIGQEDDQPYFVMEFVDGVPVVALIKRDGHLATDDALKIVFQTAQGLSAAHDQGVIHRDIKPANLMISRRGLVKVGDFGIALANRDVSSKLTSKGELVGTPGYLAPEVLSGNAVDQRSDIYALGVVLFELLTGRTPFADPNVYELMQAVLETDVPDVREFNAAVEPEVAAIVAMMLAKDPAKRYQNMRELMIDLERLPGKNVTAPIKVEISATSESSETVLGIPMPTTPRVGARVSTPSPGAGRRDSVTPLPRTGAGAKDAPTTASHSRWNVLIMAVLMFGAGAAWGFREQISELFQANNLFAAYIAGGVVTVLALSLSGYWFGVYRRRKRECEIGIQSLANMKWRDCIGLVLESMSRDGYEQTATSKPPSESGSEFLLRRGVDSVLLGYKHGTAYRIGDANVRDFSADIQMQGAAKGILVTLGSAEPAAREIATRYGIELVDGAALWPQVRPFVPANILDHVRLQTSAQAWKGIWVGIAASLVLGMLTFVVVNQVAPKEETAPAADAVVAVATTSKSDAAALKQIKAATRAMAEVATLSDAELVQRRAGALKQLTSIDQVGSAGWTSESTLLMTLKQSDGADAALIQQVCGILAQYEELRFTRLQLQPPVSSTMPVRWRQCQ